MMHAIRNTTETSPLRSSAASSVAGGHRAGLDLLRGIAAVFVMLHHAEFFYGFAGFWAHGYIAVDFFFLLSGFVLAIRYEGAMRGGLGARTFLALRIRRLWPTMAMGIVLGAAVSGLDGVPITALAVQTLVQLCFMPVFAGRFPVFPLNGVQWSLLVEFVANAAHATLLYRLTTRVCAALLLPTAAGLFLLVYREHSLAIGDVGHTWYAGFVRVAFSYLCGIVLGRWWQSRDVAESPLAGPDRRLLAGRWLSNASLAGLPLVLWLGASSIGSLRYFDPVIVTLVFPPLVWLAAHATLSPAITRVAARLGAISYPLYALHLPLIRAGELAGEGMSSVALAAVRLAALVVAIVAAWQWAVWTERRARAAAIVPSASGTGHLAQA
jgi:peptidoglycan/LPS O-acetylase OafA/YrhL